MSHKWWWASWQLLRAMSAARWRPRVAWCSSTRSVSAWVSTSAQVAAARPLDQAATASGRVA